MYKVNTVYKYKGYLEYLVYWLYPFHICIYGRWGTLEQSPGVPNCGNLCPVCQLAISQKVDYLLCFSHWAKAVFSQLLVSWLAGQPDTLQTRRSWMVYFNIMTLILNSILWAIILSFNRTIITVEVVSKVVSDIIGNCCRSISSICEVFKGIIKYFGPIIHDISTDFIIRQCQDIVEYNSCLNYCSDIVGI